MSRASCLPWDSQLWYLEEQMLTDDAGDGDGMFHPDPSALQALENSFFEALCNDKGFPSEPPDPNSSRIDDPCSLSTTDCDGGGSANTTSNTVRTLVETLEPNGSPNTAYVPDSMLTRRELVALFRRGQEEASKFLPRVNDLLNTDFVCSRRTDDEYPVLNTAARLKVNPRHGNAEEIRKGNRLERYSVEEERDELSDLFDKLFVEDCDGQARSGKQLQGKVQPQQQAKSESAAGRWKRRKTNIEVVVELEDLLRRCGRAVAGGDRGTADELLEQIRKYSSPLGNGIQRCAHYFAIALEARMAGTANLFDIALASKLQSAADLLKAYENFRWVCPFKPMIYQFASHHIFNLAQQARTLHIIDFGISYGFRWFPIIKGLSMRPGGPPKLHITGIDYPQTSGWQEKLAADSGLRLSKYCKRFGVPFQYTDIMTHNWDRIPIEDFKVDPEETVVVICELGFETMKGESEGMTSPRGSVLALIRKINPNIFVHVVENANYSLPMFSSRFLKALRHYLVYFDLNDTILSQDNQDRLWVENVFLGRSLLNVIACEGVERVVRPEGYKQWQARTEMAGFRQLPLDGKQTKALRTMLKDAYHEDYMLVEDGCWLVLGWKGRGLVACCCWGLASSG